MLPRAPAGRLDPDIERPGVPRRQHEAPRRRLSEDREARRSMPAGPRARRSSTATDGGFAETFRPVTTTMIAWPPSPAAGPVGRASRAPPVAPASEPCVPPWTRRRVQPA